MSLYESDPILETSLPIIPFKSTIQKENYDALKKNKILAVQNYLG